MTYYQRCSRRGGSLVLSTTSQELRHQRSSVLAAGWTIAGTAMNVFALPEPLRMAVVPRADHFYSSAIARTGLGQGPALAVIGEHSFYAAN